jgi:hypothetical protein
MNFVVLFRQDKKDMRDRQGNAWQQVGLDKKQIFCLLILYNKARTSELRMTLLCGRF